MKTLSKPSKLRISRVWIKHKCDESPDTSHLGEYRNNAPTSGYYVDRETNELKDSRDDSIVADGLNCNFGRNEYQYICDFQHYAAQGWEHVSDKDVASGFMRCRYQFNGRDGRRTGNLFAHFGVRGWQSAVTREQKIRCLNAVYSCCDAQRLEDLSRGDWQMLGIIAKAEIISPQGVIQTVRSGGLWGVESDASAEYMAEVEAEQLAELRAELESLGLGSRAIAYAFRNVERKD